MYSNKRKIQVATLAMLLLPMLVSAATTDSPDKSDDSSVALYSLVGLMIILLFIIALLAAALRQIGDVVKEKYQARRNSKSGIVKTLLLLILTGFSAVHSFAAETAAKAEKAIAPDVQYIKGMANTDFYALIGMIIFEIIVIFLLVFYIKKLLKEVQYKTEAEEIEEAKIEKSWFWDNFNAAVSIEKEKDILLDHNYDGIQELDNSLPPWWKYGFYLTIIVGCIYLYRFHISHDGLSQRQEYEQEMKQGEDEKAAYLAKSNNNIDETNVTLLTDAAGIADGKALFTANCAACHLADGGGVVGPNLTDDYWLHGGGIKDVFKSIKYGWQDKGMKSWKDDFSPKQIQELASFVKSLRGTHPLTPKAPQGDLYIEAGAAPAAAGASTDSTQKK